MKLLTGGKDISQLIEKITWSGDTSQVSRKINFTIAQNKKDTLFPDVSIDIGDEIIMQDDAENNVFGGIIFDADKKGSSKTVSYLAYDLLFYVNQSDVNMVFSGTPESIVTQICQKLDIPCGELAPTNGVVVKSPCFGKKAYKAIMMAYTVAARKNGTKYIPLIKNINQLCVIEKGTLCGAVMTGDYNLIDTEYKSTLQNLVNRVIITNSKGNQIKVIEDAESIQKYGLVQKVMKQSDKEDISAEAQKALVSVENAGSVSGVPNDFRAVSGYSIIVQDEVSGLYGQFYIESDTHTFTNGKAQMDLTLAFENLMDEEEIEKDTNNKKSK